MSGYIAVDIDRCRPDILDKAIHNSICKDGQIWVWVKKPVQVLWTWA